MVYECPGNTEKVEVLFTKLGEFAAYEERGDEDEALAAVLRVQEGQEGL